MLRLSQWVCPLIILGIIGCSGGDPVNEARKLPDSAEQASTETAATDNATKTDSDMPAEKSETTETTQTDPPIPVAPEKRSSLEGKWILVLGQQGSDYYIWLLDFVPSTDKDSKQVYSVKLIDSSSIIPLPELTDTIASETSTQLTFDLQGTAFDFAGELSADDGVVYGNVMVGGERCDAAKLVATKVTSMEQYGEAVPMAEREALTIAIQSPDEPFTKLRQFCRDNPTSPLCLDGYRQLIAQTKSEGLDTEAVVELADEYIAASKTWGKRMELYSHVQAAMFLSLTKNQPQAALSYLAKAEAALTPETEGWKSQIELYRTKANIANALQQASSEDAAEKKQGLESLTKFHASEPFDPSITFALAQNAEAAKQLDAAIAFYAELSAIPFMEQILQSEWQQNSAEHPLPTETLAKLWKEKNKSTEGLDNFLQKAYSKSIYSFSKKAEETAEMKAGNKVVLAELFTGAQCPPCVAADIASGGIEATYPHSRVIVLRYHQHIPGPDPLTNEDSESRFFYYQGRGTPTLTIDGATVENPGGILPQVVGLYERIQETITPLLAEKTDTKIELSANSKDGQLALSASATGLGEKTDNLRLRLVLAEENIEFIASNGIRQHEMVVRAMPGGVEGVAAKDGKLEFSESLNLAEFKKNLSEYLIAFEEGQGVEFPVKPLSLKKLHLVAFVQNDETKEIVQSASIPVSGKLDFSKPAPAKKKEEKKPAAKPADEKKKDDKKPEAKKGPELKKEDKKKDNK